MSKNKETILTTQLEVIALFKAKENEMDNLLSKWDIEADIDPIRFRSNDSAEKFSRDDFKDLQKIWEGSIKEVNKKIKKIKKLPLGTNLKKILNAQIEHFIHIIEPLGLDNQYTKESERVRSMFKRHQFYNGKWSKELPQAADSLIASTFKVTDAAKERQDESIFIQNVPEEERSDRLRDLLLTIPQNKDIINQASFNKLLNNETYMDLYDSYINTKWGFKEAEHQLEVIEGKMKNLPYLPGFTEQTDIEQKDAEQTDLEHPENKSQNTLFSELSTVNDILNQIRRLSFGKSKEDIDTEESKQPSEIDTSGVNTEESKQPSEIDTSKLLQENQITSNTSINNNIRGPHMGAIEQAKQIGQASRDALITKDEVKKIIKSKNREGVLDYLGMAVKSGHVNTTKFTIEIINSNKNHLTSKEMERLTSYGERHAAIPGMGPDKAERIKDAIGLVKKANQNKPKPSLKRNNNRPITR